MAKRGGPGLFLRAFGVTKVLEESVFDVILGRAGISYRSRYFHHKARADWAVLLSSRNGESRLARISKDNLDYCSKRRECFDCYSQGKVKASVKFQKRGKFKVPSCRLHINVYNSKASQANARKYARRSAVRRKAGLCVAPGCHNKLIPQELLPPWVRESTCGMHGAFRHLPANRPAILRFIIEHCLTDEERKGTAQNIVYKRRLGIVFFSTQYPGCYHTKAFSARGLLQRYKQVCQS